MANPDTPDVARAVEHVAEQLRGVGRLGVAFSGGVDSSVLLALAARALGSGRVVAVLGVSPSLAADERIAAHGVAQHIGVPVIEVQTREGERDAYRANGPDRCFHCKDELFTRIDDQVTARHRLDAVAYGENADDVRRLDRPGAKAAAAHRVLTPLADAGLDKAAVRRIARAFELPCAEKPAAPCLASRIPHFEIVSPRKLSEVERAEAALRRLGFGDLRVRHHGDIARVELPAEDLVRAVLEPVRGRVLQAVTEAGFRFVTLDLAGIQSGAFTGAFTRASAETHPVTEPDRATEPHRANKPDRATGPHHGSQPDRGTERHPANQPDHPTEHHHASQPDHPTGPHPGSQPDRASEPHRGAGR